MFWLKKAVTFFLMPLQAGLGLIVVGALLARFTRWRRLGRTLWIGGLMLLLAASHRQVGYQLLRPLEARYPAIPELSAGAPLPPDLAACRYIVVLGGGHADAAALPSTSRLSPHALGRIAEAVRLAHLLPDAKIITLGPAHPGQRSHAEALADAAVALGVARERIFCLDQVRDTVDEAKAVAGVTGGTPFGLVTSAWHMPRAMALMQAQGLKPLACPADFRARTHDRFTWSEWLWGLDGLERTTWAVYERLGLAWARLRGWA